MKKLLTALFITVAGFSAFGQEVAEEKKIKMVIDTFFEGFHAQDSLIMKSVVSEKVVMQSIGRNSVGEIRLHHEDFHKFLGSIVSIPAGTEFREELHSYDVKIDANMANVWTPYSLYVNGILQHCGVNSFQLFKQNGKWKIIYLVDTRKKEGCDQRKLE